MLFVEQTGDSGPLIIMLHWLGGSSRSWEPMSRLLSQSGFICAAIDLPGFGHESPTISPSISETIQQLVETIRGLRVHHSGDPWILAGHSMGGKLAMIVASLASEGTQGLDGLGAVLLVSPSPLGPEPMSETKRRDLLATLGSTTMDEDKRRQYAGTFVDDNTGLLPLSPLLREDAIADVLRSNPAAFDAWLTEGSKEDWSGKVGRLQVPTLVVAGTEEAELGLETQRKQTMIFFDNAVLVPLEGGGHLAPLERPAELADRLVEFCRSNGITGSSVDGLLGPAMAECIDSDRTSPQTRVVLLERLQDPVGTKVFSKEELRTLRALAARVVPNAGFDLSMRIDHALATARHDGWRFASLPPDKQAWRQGLLSLDIAAKRKFKVPFVALDSKRQDALLQDARNGELDRGVLGAIGIGPGQQAFDADQMRDWFEDVRGELAKLYVSDPRTMERIGFVGFADEKGFTQITLDSPTEASS